MAWDELSVPPAPELSQYAVSAKFGRGEWIQHKKFGPGLVVGTTDKKISVVFESGERLLVHRMKLR